MFSNFKPKLCIYACLAALPFLLFGCTKFKGPEAAKNSSSGSESVWTLVNETKNHADGAKEAQILGQKFPELLKQAGGKPMKSADVTVKEFKFTGTTVCPVGDPRLTYQTEAIEFCHENGNCQGESGLAKGTDDPCGI